MEKNKKDSIKELINEIMTFPIILKEKEKRYIEQCLEQSYLQGQVDMLKDYLSPKSKKL